ncbi:MAG: cysteine-rich CWC family protein [Pyrinomonadaceae bacterium]
MNIIKTEKLTCESCGKEFSCGAKTEKCWCFEVELKAETLTELREDFKNCLCWDCLKANAKRQT